MHLTFVDPVFDIIFTVFVVCLIGHFLFHILYMYDEFKEYKSCGLKLDWAFVADIILVLATVLSAIYLFWINPITITISH